MDSLPSLFCRMVHYPENKTFCTQFLPPIYDDLDPFCQLPTPDPYSHFVRK